MNTVQVNYLLITQVFFSDILKLLCTFNNHAFLSIVLHLFHLPVFSCVIILLSSFFSSSGFEGPQLMFIVLIAFDVLLFLILTNFNRDLWSILQNPYGLHAL